MSPSVIEIRNQFLALAEKHPQKAIAVLAENAGYAPKANAEDKVQKGWFLFLISELRQVQK